MREYLDIQLASDGTSVQLIGSLSVVTIKFPKTIDDLLRECGNALQNHYQHHGKSVLMIDFQKTTKIASIGFSILEADVQELAFNENAQLKLINFPTAFKPSLETRALYYRLTEQEGIHFQE